MPIVFDLVASERLLLIKLLYKKGIPLNYTDESGSNALHVACGASGSLSCVKFFVENQICTNIHQKSTNYGDTPLSLALNYRHQDIIEYFKQKFNVAHVSLDDLDVIVTRSIRNYIGRIRERAYRKTVE